MANYLSTSAARLKNRVATSSANTIMETDAAVEQARGLGATIVTVVERAMATNIATLAHLATTFRLSPDKAERNEE